MAQGRDNDTPMTWRMPMTQTHAAGMTTRPATLLSTRENERAVERIEAAERTSPYCPCGSHMLAIAHGDEVWLECAAQAQPRSGVRAVLARLTAISHTRRMIMVLPATY
jgi:hypothetical protein